MNIVMMTNTYKPIMGGLEKSVELLSEECRQRGHNVLIVAPEFQGADKNEQGVFRVPAIQNFNGTDFSVELPISADLSKTLEKFKPDIVHAHHPFLIGDTALRVSAEFDIPIIFTHHSLYEHNTHYVSDSATLKKFVSQLAIGYGNLCDHVIAPSESVRKLIIERGLKVSSTALSTGIDLDLFKKQNKKVFRDFYDIPQQAFVVGFISRIAKEKNVIFLAKAMKQFLINEKKAYFVMVGSGDLLPQIKEIFSSSDVANRFISTGALRGKQLIHAYAALDVFAFASHSETQGIVLAEAMASGVPVVGVDALGVKDIINDKKNGRLIANDNIDEMVKALKWIKSLSKESRLAMQRQCRQTAKDFTVEKFVNQMLTIYEQLSTEPRIEKDIPHDSWKKTIDLIKAQVHLILNTSKAAISTLDH